LAGSCRENGKERGPAKALQLTLEGSKQGRPKRRWKELVEKDMVDRGLKKTDTKDRLLWKSGCKNRLTPACRDNLPCYRMSKEKNP